ncbi:hypothetical protein [Spirillospora sp. CA-294931]|uniref:hypothetical protein n=1 Tax=Spirillospora sp. CA-294931 TaxID=3240042 RepID=UPI003D92EAD3
MQISRKSHTAALIAVSTAAAGAMVVTTGAVASASAGAKAAPRNTCGVAHACGYDYVNYGGREFFDRRVRPGQVINIPNNMLGSVANRTGHKLCIMDWNGTITVVPPHSGIRDLGDAKNKADTIRVRNPGQRC